MIRGGTLLIIDDLFSRNVDGGRNRDRENICAHFLLRDVTGDAAALASRQRVMNPTAEAVFCRGQVPELARIGAVVENDLRGAMARVREGWAEALARGQAPWSMVLLDLCFYTGEVTEHSNRRALGMPVGRAGDDEPTTYFGLALLDAIHGEFPELPVVILSSKPREEVSLQLSERGALGFIARSDVRGSELLEDALWQHGLLPDPEGEFAGNSLAVLLALREARRAARHRQNVLIRGERGSGKELLAGYLHRMSGPIGGKSNRAFVAVNSAAFAPNLFASELFGIEPKTATNVDGKIGLIEAANGGDLFLDEIGDMPPEVQAAVLRVLQDRQVVRVGGRQPKDVDVRFISATNSDIELARGGFRPDLLDRLRLGGSLVLPPLRERKSDIPLLAEKFVREAEGQRPGSMRRNLTAEALDKLSGYDWPGNIRELRSCMFDAVNRHPDVEHLVAGHLRIGAAASPLAPSVPGRSLPKETVANAGIGSGLLGDLMVQLESFDFPTSQVGAWAGRLPEVQHAQARLLARYLQAAIDATKRRTPESPQGQIQIHPAVKLITGDSLLTASKAADVVKRLLGPLDGELEGDLLEAYNTSVRLRPKSARKFGGKAE